LVKHVFHQLLFLLAPAQLMTKRTLRGTRLKKIRTSGFRHRMAEKTGRKIVNARRSKGRTKLTV